MLAVLNIVQHSKNVTGSVAEIGVHHGRLFIGLSLLQAADQCSVAIDLFGDQELNIDKSGKGDLAAFQRNLRRWASPSSVAIHQGDSTKLKPAQVLRLANAHVRLFSVDGGHTESIVLSDMKLAEATLTPGGIVIADDVFNAEWPDVATGTLRYLHEGGELIPFVIGFNKVLFATPDYAHEYRFALQQRFEHGYMTKAKTSEFATHEVLIVGRVPRRPRDVLRQHAYARKVYNRIRR